MKTVRLVVDGVDLGSVETESPDIGRVQLAARLGWQWSVILTPEMDGSFLIVAARV